ncbi:MAG: hypothetical protein ACTSXW_00780 [Candidatus Baldrarchaeia archaeon]
MISLDVKELARKAKVHYVIIASEEEKLSMLYNRRGEKTAKGKFYDYLKFAEKIREERKRYLIYFKYKNTVSVYNKFGDIIWEGKLEDLPKLQDRKFYEKLPKLPEKVKKCKTVLEAVITLFKDKIVDPTSVIDTSEEVWSTRVIVENNIISFPEKNAWVVCINFGVPDIFGDEATGLISENFVYLLKTDIKECFNQARPKTIYLCFDNIPPAEVRDRCRILNTFRAIAKKYGYQTVYTG